MFRHFLLFIALLFPLVNFSQQKEDPNKMFRAVVNVQVEKSKFAPPPPPVTQPVVTDKKGKKKPVVVEEPPAEDPAADTANPFMPAPVSEVVKRAQNWYKSENKKFVKSNGANSGNNVTCTVAFPFKQKILNPENDVDGKILMDVVIEAKEGKYRYTVKNLRHKADKAGMSGGDVYLQVPECGSMKLNDRTWKHIRSDAFAHAQVLVDDLKEFMMKSEVAETDEW